MPVTIKVLSHVNRTWNVVYEGSWGLESWMCSEVYILAGWVVMIDERV